MTLEDSIWEIFAGVREKLGSWAVEAGVAQREEAFSARSFTLIFVIDGESDGQSAFEQCETAFLGEVLTQAETSSSERTAFLKCFRIATQLGVRVVDDGSDERLIIGLMSVVDGVQDVVFRLNVVGDLALRASRSISGAQMVLMAYGGKCDAQIVAPPTVVPISAMVH